MLASCADPKSLEGLAWLMCYLTSGKHLLFYLSFGTVLLLLAIVFFVIKNAYANWRVRERVAPSRANASGWFLFLGLMAVATIAVLGFVNSGRFLAPLYLVPLGGLACVSLIAWLTTFSAKR